MIGELQVQTFQVVHVVIVLNNLSIWSSVESSVMYKLIYFVPLSYKEETKQALFELGVGKYENYDLCAFETQGMGQFRPIAGANPHLGEVDRLERVEEFRIEMICVDDLIHEAVQVLKAVHPYEEVAYEVYKLEII